MHTLHLFEVAYFLNYLVLNEVHPDFDWYLSIVDQLCEELNDETSAYFN